jgi:chromosome segregation ATPase
LLLLNPTTKSSFPEAQCPKITVTGSRKPQATIPHTIEAAVTMVQPGFGLDTPRTNVGDATYLSRQPDFDISQEASFQSPGKDNNLLQQLRNGRSGRINLSTPRGRAPFADRINLPAGIGGAEFTPMLKSATRNSARRGYGKENGAVPATPALDRIEEDLTPIPSMDTSVYTSRNMSYMDNTLPQVDSSSTASTPMVMLPRRGDGSGPLHDGNQLSLREQENVIDKIEKENFGLKLKIHFLEEALRKAGPGFSEAALKENTELKVDKVTMQRELHKYKKHLTSAERDLESYRQQMLELQEKAKRKYADESQRVELERLRKSLEDREADIEDLQRQLDQEQQDNGQLDKLQDEIGDLEADIREKDRVINEHEDEADALREKLQDFEDKIKDSQRRMVEMEEKANANDDLEEAKDTIDDLERQIRQLEEQIEAMKEKVEDAVTAKDRAEGDLEELQDEMANKSVVTKGLSRQIEEKLARLQAELEKSEQDYATLEKQHAESIKENDDLRSQAKDLKRERDFLEREYNSATSRLDGMTRELQHIADEKNLLQTRHEALTNESASLQKHVSSLQKSVEELEDSLAQEREHALEIEKNVRDQYKNDISCLNDEISDLQAEIREKDNLYDNDSEKWENERHTLESERDRAEERAMGLQRTIEKLRDAEGTLSDKESKLQEAIQSETERHRSEEAVLSRQIEDLQQDLEARQAVLTGLRNEISALRDELRQTRLDYQSQSEKLEGLEDEVEVLQATLDEETEQAQKELNAAKQQCGDLEEQLNIVRSQLEMAQSSSASTARDGESEKRLRLQLSESTAQLANVLKENQSLQDQLVEAKAEREEAESELRRHQLAAASNPLRVITEGDSELSGTRRDLAAARQKELEYLQRESSQRETIKGLKSQIADLERKIYETEMSRLMPSPSSAGGSARKAEITELRHQLSTSLQTIQELKGKVRDTERKAGRTSQDVQQQLDELEDQKLVLEQSLEDARQDLQEVTARHEKTTRKYKHKLEKLESERREAALKATSASEKRDLHEVLRKTQKEADALEHDVLQQQETIDELSAAEASLRRKLERARSERAAYRLAAEKLQKDVKELKDSASRYARDNKQTVVRFAQEQQFDNGSNSALETVIRAAEGAEERHTKELRGMALQMEWMQARWEREAMMRADAAYAKKFLQLELDVANTW